MTRYTSTASKRTRTMAQLLTVAMTATLIVAITACQGEQTPPTPRPQTEDRSPMQTIEAMASEIAALQTQAAESGETDTGEQPRPTEEPSTAVAPATETPEPTAVAPATETPEPTATLPPPPKHSPSDNICRRSPGVQNDLIRKLEMSSCRIITNDELFRLNSEFSTNITQSPIQGDFAGMTNLRKLTMRIYIPRDEKATLPEQLFHGMSKLETLDISSRGELSINSNAIHNLPNLKTLSITSNGRLVIEKDFVSEVPELTELELSTTNDTQSPPMSHAKTFMNLPELETLSINSWRVKLTEETFSKNPKLVSVKISATTSGHRTAFSKLHKLEHLQLSATNSGKQPEVVLSPKSPLMKALLNQQQYPIGYKVIPPGGES